MKKSIILLILVLMSVSLFGSVEKHIPGKNRHGFYFKCPSITFTELNKSPSFGLGLRAGWIFNHSFSLGIGGNLFFTNIKANSSDTINYGMGYLGVIVEYIFKSKESLHVTMSTLIGGGIIGPWQSYNGYCCGYSSGRFITSANSDGFLVLEPGIDLLMNISWLIQVGAGVSYRIVSGIEKYGFSNPDLSGFSLNLIFQLRLF